MLDKITQLEVNGQSYPLAFTLNVMANLQEKYGSLDKWGSVLQPEQGEPSFKEVIYTYTQFINEGIEIENEENGLNRALLTERKVGRLLSQVGLKNAIGTMQNLTSESTKTDEKNE